MQCARSFTISMMITVSMIVVVLCPSAFADESANKARIELAKKFVNQMTRGEFEKAVKPFDKVMTKALPAEKLKAIWSGLISQYGPLQRIAGTRTEALKQYQIVFVTCQFERGKLDAKLVFTDENAVTGLFFVSTGSYQAPAYVNQAAFTEVELTVGKGLWSLPGTLSLPKGEGPFSAVVLVHGSGPHDRDETMGPNKPFRDLAQGLASQGIAVLRYEKRTRHHRLKIALFAGGLTVKEETVDDAVAAVETLTQYLQIDGDHIFVLGHSLGGNLLPRIGAASDKIAGFISFAGSVRPLEDLVLEQVEYLLSLDGTITAEEQQKLDAIIKQVGKVKSPELSEKVAASELPLGVSAKYWLDLRGYNAAESAKALKKPLLVLQGKRDYQVTLEDFGKWKKALGTRDDVKLILYPKLNHLFMAGEGKSSPAEYTVPGNVAHVVVSDIANWIKAEN